MKQLFYCDICGARFDNSEDCQKCESFHIAPMVLVTGAYKPFFSASSPYLESIVVRMKDGVLVRYSFCETLNEVPADNANQIEKGVPQ